MARWAAGLMLLANTQSVAAQQQPLTLDIANPGMAMMRRWKTYADSWIDSVKSVSRSLADSCMAFYDGDKPGGIPGLLPPTAVGSYNWWQSGAMWTEMIEYWFVMREHEETRD